MNDLTVTDMRAHPGDSAFLIDDGTTAVLYDSGFAFTGYAVADKIKAYLGDRSLDYIFLTHSHYDHALGSVYVRRYWPQVQVVAGAYAAKIFTKPSARAVMRELDGKLAARCGAASYEDLIDDLRVDISVADGDTIRAGKMTFTAVALPGHTCCSMGYYCAERRLLLGTETLGVYDGKGGVVPSYLVGYQMTLESIRRAQGMEIDQILVPHYGLLDKAQTAAYLQTAMTSAVETAEEILCRLRAGWDKTAILSFFKDKFYHGYIRTIYPVDAMELNTGITIDLLERECLG